MRGTCDKCGVGAFLSRNKPEPCACGGTVTSKEHRSDEVVRAEGEETVAASGNSEGAKKGWEGRPYPHRQDGEDESGFMVRMAGRSPHEMIKKDWDRFQNYEYLAGGSRRERQGMYGMGTQQGRDSVHRSWVKQAVEKGDSVHPEVLKDYPEFAKASDATSPDVVHCRAHSATGTKLGAGEPWQAGERVEFMWMPAGVSTITAGFRKGSIELTVQCDEHTAAEVQASLDEWRAKRPKQEPFGCIEHREQEASFRVSASGGFKWNEDGVYLAAEPTTLGAQNVNGKVHRSWSPSFTTDAEYDKATERGGVLVFPVGARGSRGNPARITGVDFCVGTLTNKPAFHSMSPVRAKEGDAVTAAGTSEGAKKGWETKRIGHTLGSRSPNSTTGRFSQDAADASNIAEQSGNPAHHREAANLHGQAANRHYQAASKAYENGAQDGTAMFHQLKSEQHMQAAKEHMDAAKQGGTSGGFQHATDATASTSVQAHCAAAFFQDVPDGTDAELKSYEEMVESGHNHAEAVEFIRLGRRKDAGHKPSGETMTDHPKASEQPTLETIHARAERAADRANQIASREGVAKLTAADVYERFSVKAAGTSEGAKKGWEHRSAFAFQDSQRAAHKTTAVGDFKPMSGAYLTAHKNAALAHGAAAKSHREALEGADDHYKDVHSRQAEFHDAKERSHWAGWRQEKDVKATDATPDSILERIYARAETVSASGTSEGVKKAWIVRKLGGDIIHRVSQAASVQHAKEKAEAMLGRTLSNDEEIVSFQDHKADEDLVKEQMGKASWQKQLDREERKMESRGVGLLSSDSREDLQRIYARAGESR